MKIAHINMSDLAGGAAIACYRLHLGLLNSGIESRLFVLNKLSNDSTVIGLKNGQIINRIQEKIDKIPLKLYPYRIPFFFSNGWLAINTLFSRVSYFEPDIIHLHWVGNSIVQISKLSNFNKPIIWSLHDLWAFTGGCHNNYQCNKFKNNCGECPNLGSKENNDLSKKNFRIKEKSYNKIKKLTIIGLSRWLTEMAKSSHLLKDFNIHNLPNCINTELFNIQTHIEINKFNYLPKNKKIVFCGTSDPQSTFVKGFVYMQKLIENIDKQDKYILLLIGKEQNYSLNKTNIYFIDTIKDELAMIDLYNIVDVVVHPSVQENLSNVIMESMSCGTPVVAFDVGGNSDLIKHKNTGYLATPFNQDDLIEGIHWVLDQKDHGLSTRNRNLIIENYDTNLITPKYIKIYETVLR